MKDPVQEEHHKRRLLDFLAQGAARIERDTGDQLLLSGPRGRIAVPLAVLDAALQAIAVERAGETVTITENGRAVRRGLQDAFAAQHRELAEAAVKTDGEWETVTVNLAESPLAQLARRRDRAGRAYLGEEEIRAGERLRADFTRGQLMPRLSANWNATVSAAQRGRGGAGGMADLTDAALAARQRVERAINATGPELSGVLLDICCFLKGLEQVEAERGWPVRSGKVMLKAALSALARHYEPARSSNRQQRVLHWGTDDYRPTVR
ncbi:DUF6456 domain-containing protein [Tianweitania sediminis]|uniref:DUF6456 domain-containing protein n=1 Tax=Tianweitania sediminis TaxID=1502156 RepID=A0A8J7R285_9HYPH|nr:DUF6456 domain-containing protein [Tianweitania sediminis]MBP0438880.1 hypothetical protein [Tianweitania sediminis]